MLIQQDAVVHCFMFVVQHFNRKETLLRTKHTVHTAFLHSLHEKRIINMKELVLSCK